MGFYIQDDMWEAVSELPRKTQDEVLGALARLFFEGEQTELKGVSKSLFIAFRDRVLLSQKRSDCGKQNGKQKREQNESKPQSKTEAKPEPSIKEGDREGDIEKDNPKGLSKKTPRFTPPSPDEVSAYAEQAGVRIDPHRFCDHYAANGWRVGGRSPMKDWRAAVRNWARNDAQWASGRKEAEDDAELDLYASLV